MKLKLNDVYRFRYNDEYCSKSFNLYWCFIMYPGCCANAPTIAPGASRERTIWLL